MPALVSPVLDVDVDLGEGVRVHGPYLLVRSTRGLVVAWRSWQVLTPQEVEEGPWPSGWGARGERHWCPSGHVLWLTRRAGYLSWFTGSIDRLPGGSLDDSSNINGGVIYKVFVSAQHRRKGLASAMLAMARDLYPQMHIRHSKALSVDGAAWAAATP